LERRQGKAHSLVEGGGKSKPKKLVAMPSTDEAREEKTRLIKKGDGRPETLRNPLCTGRAEAMEVLFLRPKRRVRGFY